MSSTLSRLGSHLSKDESVLWVSNPDEMNYDNWNVSVLFASAITFFVVLAIALKFWVFIWIVVALLVFKLLLMIPYEEQYYVITNQRIIITDLYVSRPININPEDIENIVAKYSGDQLDTIICEYFYYVKSYYDSSATTDCADSIVLKDIKDINFVKALLENLHEIGLSRKKEMAILLSKEIDLYKAKVHVEDKMIDLAKPCFLADEKLLWVGRYDASTFKIFFDIVMQSWIVWVVLAVFLIGGWVLVSIAGFMIYLVLSYQAYQSIKNTAYAITNQRVISVSNNKLAFEIKISRLNKPVIIGRKHGKYKDIVFYEERHYSTDGFSLRKISFNGIQHADYIADLLLMSKYTAQLQDVIT